MMTSFDWMIEFQVAVNILRLRLGRQDKYCLFLIKAECKPGQKSLARQGRDSRPPQIARCPWRNQTAFS
jgi:hypothetical protein